mgnify:CR=1 FL=1
MGSKFFRNRHEDKTSKGKRQIKGSKKNTNSKIKSKGVGRPNMAGVRKGGRGK